MVSDGLLEGGVTTPAPITLPLLHVSAGDVRDWLEGFRAGAFGGMWLGGLFRGVRVLFEMCIVGASI
ncbi:hypothetical protein Afil01_69380 [Actinorhabdospora filicis]|uniref:Uncharacterized protein n=1 Tax=Actinorhabdospora filicis TaxID=1785913 RepID=A0A9W6WE10_9ACTN|nr:hypothetical protein Afil01_69380 [Actinorhabdospora filicis]